jgi:hypothetical protein
MPEQRKNQLARVVYRSHSLLPEEIDDRAPVVAEILRVARRNNTQTGLTGVLLFDGTSFLQAIEGNIEAVESIYESIACDRRHEDIEVIEFKPIGARDYRSFPMAYVEGLDAERATLGHLRAALVAAGGAEFDMNAIPSRRSPVR